MKISSFQFGKTSPWRFWLIKPFFKRIGIWWDLITRFHSYFSSSLSQVNHICTPMNWNIFVFQLIRDEEIIFSIRKNISVKVLAWKTVFQKNRYLARSNNPIPLIFFKFLISSKSYLRSHELKYIYISTDKRWRYHLFNSEKHLREGSGL